MAGPILAIVVARSRNGVIGREGGLPWRLKSDMAMFKANKLGKPGDDLGLWTGAQRQTGPAGVRDVREANWRTSLMPGPGGHVSKHKAEAERRPSEALRAPVVGVLAIA